MHQYLGSKRRRRSLALAGALALVVAIPGVAALDVKGRTDTGYSLSTGDSALVNRVYNTHTLDLGLAPGMSVSLYGGLSSAFGPGPGAGNILRNLNDAYNGNAATWVDYNLYAASFQYSSSLFGLSVGRRDSLLTELSAYDGLNVWVAPLPWLRVEAFGGIPWQDPSLLRLATSLSNEISKGALEAGAKVRVSLLGDTLSVSGEWTYLSQLNETTALIGGSTSLDTDQVARFSASYSPAEWLSAGASGSLVNWLPLDASAWAAGYVQGLHLSYGLNANVQALDIGALGEQFSSFSDLLGAAQPFIALSGDLSEEISGFLPANPILKSASIDLGFGHRQPLDTGKASKFNPSWNEFRAGPSLAFAGGFSVSGYYSLLLTDATGQTATPANTINGFGGELREKLGALDLRLGTSFSANEWDSSYTAYSMVDKFAAQDYYLRAKYQLSKALDLSLKASYETALLASITTLTPVNTDTLTPAYTLDTTDLNSAARNTLHFEIRAGFRY
jgi:hypothetical protein